MRPRDQDAETLDIEALLDSDSVIPTNMNIFSGAYIDNKNFCESVLHNICWKPAFIFF